MLKGAKSKGGSKNDSKSQNVRSSVGRTQSSTNMKEKDATKDAASKSIGLTQIQSHTGTG